MELVRKTFRKVCSVAYKVVLSFRRDGIIKTLKKIKKVLKARIVERHHLIRDVYPLKKELRMQRRRTFVSKTKFSIIVPLYNTPPFFLKEMIDSVISQTYSNWELCLADGSDSDHLYVSEICKQYVSCDNRIRYKKLEKNGGISENSNASLEMAQGEYIALLDHDDYLLPNALYENMLVIEDCDADFIYSDEMHFVKTYKSGYNMFFKPDFSPDSLRGINYICHFTVFKRTLIEMTGGFRSEFDGSQDHDLFLRLTEKAKTIKHIPKILYCWRAHPGSVASGIEAKPYCIAAAHRALTEHLHRVGLSGTVHDAKHPTTYRIKYDIKGTPKITILIPNKDHVEELKKCILSIQNISTYRNYEIVIIENNSEDEETFSYYERIKEDPQIKVVFWQGEFNYSAINNFGSKFSTGEYLLLLNNDVEVITPDWLQEMLMFAQRNDVGAVGAKLSYPDDTIQHAGVVVGADIVAEHIYYKKSRDYPGYFAEAIYARNLSAVTGACLMLRKEVFDEVGGLEERLKIAFNDIDLCMKITKAGYRIVCTPFAELYHYESLSRGYEDTPEKIQRFTKEVELFKERWTEELEKGDPYCNRFVLSLI